MIYIYLYLMEFNRHLSYCFFHLQIWRVLIFYSWRLFELLKDEKKSRGKQIEVHWRHCHKFWSITLHIEGWCVAKPLIVLHNAFLLHINCYLHDFCFAQNSLCDDIAELIYIKPPILCRAQGIDFLTWGILQKVGVIPQSLVLKQLGA